MGRCMKKAENHCAKRRSIQVQIGHYNVLQIKSCLVWRCMILWNSCVAVWVWRKLDGFVYCKYSDSNSLIIMQWCVAKDILCFHNRTKISLYSYPLLQNLCPFALCGKEMRCLTLKQLCKENRRALLSCLNLLCSHFTNKAKVVETVSRLLILYLSVSRLLLLCLHLNWITCLRLVPLFYFAKHIIYRRGYSQAYGIHLPVVSRSSWLLPWRDACVLSMPLRARTPCCISVVNIQAPE